ncbi:hypothetical protein MRX96_034563 [Rhipicephalus microplus]
MHSPFNAPPFFVQFFLFGAWNPILSDAAVLPTSAAPFVVETSTAQDRLYFQPWLETVTTPVTSPAAPSSWTSPNRADLNDWHRLSSFSGRGRAATMRSPFNAPPVFVQTKYLGSVELHAAMAVAQNGRYVEVNVGGYPLVFKVDSAADVSMVPRTIPGCPAELDKPRGE